MKASDLFIRCLENEGVDTIFGVPGEENADLMISLLNSSIEFIVCRHEQAAAFMADLYGRLTGRPGVCLATLGPGSTNLTTGVASANLDYSPLVAIVGQAGTRRLHKESHQNMDSVSMFKPIAKWVSTVRDPGSIPEVVRKAFKLAAAEKPGAAVIELPEDIAKEETTAAPLPVRHTRHEFGVDIHLVEKALEMIRGAQAPIILVGNGCVRERMGGTRPLLEFIEKTGIYSANTFMGKGALPARHDHNLYCVGLGLKDIVLEAFEESDLVICIGYDMVEWPPDRWNVGRKKGIIHIDTHPAEVDQHYMVDVDISGDIGETIEAMNARLTDGHRKDNPQFAALRDRMTYELRRHDNDPGFPMKPQRILSDLRSVMRDEDIVISDVGAHKMWVARHYPSYKPGTCIISNGFCSMGIALPGAIAAKKLFPKRNVVALCGDGGFLMNVQDLITATRYKIPLTVLIWDDKGYGLIKWKQEMHYCKSSHTDLVNPDFVKLAESFGCHGVAIEQPDQLKPALLEAFERTDRPSIITVPVDYDENLKLTAQFGELHCFNPEFDKYRK